MGVKGLWSLLNPVARPVQSVNLVQNIVETLTLYCRIESMEGKRLAIDSSIWLYQVCPPLFYVHH
jgi:DNA excision repair protein ERCC-5